VEVANSLLRIGELLPPDSALDWSSRATDALSPYLDWLDGRLIRGRTVDESPFQGWQSDHTHRQGLVHLWATSQVLLFCGHYGALAQEHLARVLRTEVDVPAERPPSKSAKDWDEAERKEPLAGLPASSSSRVYSLVRRRYVDPRNGADGFVGSSILLYGPPGTGKTSFAEDLANVLGFDLLTVTPSDFIQLGEARVEARAHEVFRMLLEQSESLVLFDEIDRLILSRDGKHYGAQSDMFQFMTPSMLTKLNRLKRDGRVLSIIATNYEDRLDNAIKRQGRIDDTLLLLPPDQTQRKRIITDLLKKEAGGIPVDTGDVNKVVAATPLFAYQELKFVVEGSIPGPPGELGTRLQAAASEFLPAISLSAYRRRFDWVDESDSQSALSSTNGPWREVLFLSYLELEVGANPCDRLGWLKPVLSYAIDTQPAIDDVVKQSVQEALS
jgi:hypothetical protein